MFSRKQKHLLFFTISLITLFVSSCSRPMGYGVLVWSEDEAAYPTGSLLAVYEKSTIMETYKAGLPESKVQSEFPIWRIRYFQNEVDAAEYQNKIKEYTNMYAVSSRTGLPIRLEPSTSGSRIYKLADNQTIKVLGRQEEKVEIGQFTGYWYNVITDDGTEGWCFDYYLNIYTLEDGNQVFLQKERKDDSTLETIFGKVWRPDFYQKAEANGQINLSLFRSDYKLVFDGENKTIIYRSAGRRFERSFEDVVKLKADTYEFVGASFRVIVYGSDFLSIQFSEDNKEIGEAWITLDKSIDEIIQGELNRRERVLNRLVNNGPEYKSDKLGTLSFTPSGEFTWNGKSRLISRKLITSKAGYSGKVYFDHFPGADIMRKYDGAMRMRFQNDEELVFLYRFANTSITLVYVNPREINNSIIQTDFNINSLEIEFSPEAPVALESETDSTGDSDSENNASESN